MAEDLVCTGNKVLTETGLKNYETTFGVRCAYHTTRKAVVVLRKVPMCEYCAMTWMEQNSEEEL